MLCLFLSVRMRAYSFVGYFVDNPLICTFPIFTYLLTLRTSLVRCLNTVCINTVQKFADHVKANKLRKDADIESGIKEVCASLTDAKEKRMCYYVGGSKDAASSMLRTLSKPLGFGLPAIKICDRLKKKDISICELSYPKPLVLSELEPLKKQRVKVLKKVTNQSTINQSTINQSINQ